MRRNQTNTRDFQPRTKTFITDNRMSKASIIADLQRALDKLHDEKSKDDPDTYEILKLKEEINRKMIRWDISDPSEFGAVPGEIDM